MYYTNGLVYLIVARNTMTAVLFYMICLLSYGHVVYATTILGHKQSKCDVFLYCLIYLMVFLDILYKPNFMSFSYLLFYKKNICSIIL